MSTTHGLYIPSPDRLYDLESFLTYLGRLVFEWHECLYCGVEKGSLEGVQTHMRDKGHCKVKMEDMQEFWEEESGTEEDDDEEEVNKRAGKKESVSKPRRRDTTKPRRTHRHTALITTFKSTSSPPSPTAPDTQASHNTHLSLQTPKTALSLAGLSSHDKRLLHATDKKMATKAALAQARNKQRMVMAPVLTKYYKTENPVYMAG
jgi:pre-60S factor REI1